MQLNEFNTGFLQDHAPHWLDLIHRDKIGSADFRHSNSETSPSKGYNINDASCCIVGECYGKSGLYNYDALSEPNSKYCDKCAYYSCSFPSNLISAMKGSRPAHEYFERELTEFAVHFTECHSKIPKPQKEEIKIMA